MSGYVYESNGSTIISSARVVLTNTTTSETLNYTTSALGEFIFNLANLPSGFQDGDEISLYCAYGNNYDEQYIIVNVSVGSSEQNLTLSNSITAAPVYTSIAGARRVIGVDTAEFSDNAIYDMIKAATGLIDEETGRTWKGIQTSTLEFFDGLGDDTLWLNRADVQSVSAVQIDDDDDGTYTAVTSSNSNTSSGAWVYKDEGYLILDDDANINKFTVGPKTVRVTYTYGNKRPTELVRQLCVAIVQNIINFNRDRQAWIDKTIDHLKAKGPWGMS